jgi:hypothetical protein
MNRKRSIIMTAGLVMASLLMTVLPARAAVLSGPQATASARHLTAPPAPTSTQLRFAAAVSPSISPAANFTWVAPNSDFNCPLKNLCTGVWDPTRSLYKFFYLFSCNWYAVSNWNGGGFYVDNQTDPSPTSTFYDQNGVSIFSFQPVLYTTMDYNWDPVWFIRNC